MLRRTLQKKKKKTAMLIIHRAGRIGMTQCSSFDAKHVRTQVKSIVSISHFHMPRRVPGADGKRVLAKGRNSFALEISNLEDRGGLFFSSALSCKARKGKLPSSK